MAPLGRGGGAAMIAWRLLPVVLSLVVLGAHALRGGQPALVVLVVGLLSLLLVPRAWAARSVQVALWIGSLEWVRALVVLAGARLRAGEPAAWLTIILGCVALATALSSLCFRAARVRTWYGLEPSGRGPAEASGREGRAS